MPQIIAWKCPQTGKLFDQKSLYKRHLKNVAKSNIEKRKINKDREELLHFFEELSNRVRNIDQLTEEVLKNQNYFWAASSRHNSFSYRYIGKIQRGKVITIPKLVYIKFKVEWNNNISNTHSAPRNGVTNWYREEDKPKSYPGWKGRITFKIDGCVQLSHLFDNHICGINTVAGGGGTDSEFNYEVCLFADDWPEMYKSHQNKELIKLIKG